MLRALDSTESRRDRCDAGVPEQRGEQNSVKLHAKAFYIVSSSDFPRKDLDRWRIPSLWLALEASFAKT